MEFIIPMEPILSNDIIDEDGWIHQIKWDGIRCISYIENNSIKLYTKKGNERTQFYPELHKVVDIINSRQAILDGEIVVLNEEKRPSFSNIMVRERIRKLEKLPYYMQKFPVKYIIFDILYFNGKNLMTSTLKERQYILNQNIIKTGIITTTDNFADGLSLFNLMKSIKYEGIVSKRLSSVYTSGKKHSDWYKIKIERKMLAVIGGVKTKHGYPISLMLGIYSDEGLTYIGSVSSGLKSTDFQLIKKFILKLKVNNRPFINIDTTNDDIIWIKPQITCWIKFLEWTNKGSIRNPKLIGFSKNEPREAIGKEEIYDRSYRSRRT